MVSLERRRSAAGETLLVFNESWSPRKARLHFTRAGGVLTLWDPRSGSRVRLREHVKAGDIVAIELDAAETLILTLGLAESRVPSRLTRETPQQTPFGFSTVIR